MKITSFEITDDPAAAGAQEIAEAVQASVSERGRCALALSRAAEMFRNLGSALVPWEAVELFQVDERAAPDGSPDRNLIAIELELCAHIAGAKPHAHPMTATGDLEAGAVDYAAELERVCGRPVVLDVVHLGLGADGHTASLLPGDPVLNVRDRQVAVTGPYEGYRRMTLTYPVLDAAGCVVFVVSGAAKASAVAAVLAGDASIPAARLQAADVRFFVDGAAAGVA